MGTAAERRHVWSTPWPKIRQVVITRALKIGVVGQTGQLARALADICQNDGLEAVFLNRQSLDLSGAPSEIKSQLSPFHDVDVIINSAAYTAVDNAEDDKETAFAVNERAVKALADFCHSTRKPLVHVSTDYVFNGQSQSPYSPNDAADPLSVYGASKYQGEGAVIASGCHYAIVRTSWVYDASGKNFMTTMLRLAKDRDALSVVDDQRGRPTYAPVLAQACLTAAASLHQDPSHYKGTYHVSGTGGVISWADFAREIFQLSASALGKNITVSNITTAQYPTKAARPAYSALDTERFEHVFKMQLPDWKSSLKTAIRQWEKNQ